MTREEAIGFVKDCMFSVCDLLCDCGLVTWFNVLNNFGDLYMLLRASLYFLCLYLVLVLLCCVVGVRFLVESGTR